MRDLKTKSRIKLCHLGQFYAAVSNEKNPGVFSITAYLKETLIPGVLQKAVDDLMKRLPFINVRLRKGLFWYYHEVLENTPQIIDASDAFIPLQYFEKGNNHLIRIIHDDQKFTVEVFHTICDGRSLSKIVTALLARYFELLDVNINKENIIDCNDKLEQEEFEVGYIRYAGKNKSVSNTEKRCYVLPHELSDTKVIVNKINLNEIKLKAKNYGGTITAYILTHIFDEFAKKRKEDANDMPITAMIPIDCRSYFPTKSLRNFVSEKKIIMPETDSFNEITKQLKEQFEGINADLVQSKFSTNEKMIRLTGFIPLFIKNWLIKIIGGNVVAGYTTTFSNLGLIRLPEEIQHRVDSLAFALGPEKNMPYLFGAISVGDTLTLTSTVTTQDTEIINNMISKL